MPYAVHAATDVLDRQATPYADVRSLVDQERSVARNEEREQFMPRGETRHDAMPPHEAYVVEWAL